MAINPAAGAVRRSIQTSLSDKLAEVSKLNDALNVEVFLLAERCENAQDALERLHARIHRDLPGDGSEVPEPQDEYWARTLTGLVAFADEVYLPIADGGV